MSTELLPRLSGRLSIVCAYCGDKYGEKLCEPEMDGEESHGCCPACFPEVSADLARELKFSCGAKSQPEP